MLADFQQALADLTASPELCIEVRNDPAVLHARYDLTEREAARLAGIVGHPGMECACMVYRANRLAPLALNIPDTCRALGQDLRDILSEYWAEAPESNVHFYVETDRFCRFLEARIAEGRAFPPAVAAALARESALVAAALEESRIEAGYPATT
jgi:hypothetical protein